MRKLTGIILLLIITIAPITSLALSYTPYTHVEGVNGSDRTDYKAAVDNTAGTGEDTLRYLFQGPATIGVPGYSNTTMGYMKDIVTNVSNLGTIGYIAYPTNWTVADQYIDQGGVNSQNLYWLNIISQDSPLPLKLGSASATVTGPNTERPIEGWIVSVNLTPYIYKEVFDKYVDNVIVTYSDPYGNVGTVYNGTYIRITGVNTSVIVDNARLKVVKTTVFIGGVFLEDDPSTPSVNETIYIKLRLDMATVVSKVAKTVRIYHNLTVTDVRLGPCDHANLTIALSRVAIIDACPICSISYYHTGYIYVPNGANPVGVGFITLAWINKTLQPILNTTLRDIYNVNADYKLGYFADYMLAYPYPDHVAVLSVINDTLSIPVFYYSEFIGNRITVSTTKYDQAFIRYEWEAQANGTREDLLKLTIMRDNSLPMVIYGVYDVGPNYTGTLSVGFVNGYVTDAQIRGNESHLSDIVDFLDLNQNGIIDITESNIPVAWYPTDEFAYQLRAIFDPVTFSKFNESTTEGVDFIVLPPSGAGADSAAATYLAMLRSAALVLFDIEPNGMVASIAYKYPSSKMLPYLALKLANWAVDERYGERRSHFVTDDGRALLPSEFTDVDDTPWKDDRYVLITVAGPHPNLVTYYFNDFSDIVRAMGGDLGTVIVVPSAGGKVYDIMPYIGDSNYGLAVVALARDNYGRTALLVHGLAAQDTYWAAYYVLNNWANIVGTYGDYSAILLEINYTSANLWAVGGGLPITHHTMPTFDVLVAATPYNAVFP